MKNKNYLFGVLFILFPFFFFNEAVDAQQLVQSFIEQNILGSSNFGCSVSGAGDVNGDGYDDVIVGANNYNNYTGRAYIYYGAGSMDAEADVTLNGEGISNYFGASVSGAGDVNGDGYDDVIVGAYRYNSSTGRAYIYYGAGSMDAEADVTLNGEGTSNNFGYSVSGAGDVNGDGYDDVIVGAYYYNSYTGRAYIYYGAGSMDAEADVTLNGEGTSNNFGYSVSGAGDVNGDGYDEVIVGAYRYNSNTGKAYIYYGAGSMDTEADVTLNGEGTSNNFGYSVSGAGDVNGDGYDDVIVGANNYNSSTGRAYIYYGAGSMDAEADVTFDGEGASNNFGYSVSGAGDVNGDGYDDVIVGAYRYNSYTGRAYIYYGAGSMDAEADVTLNGEGTYNYFGYSVSGAGDVNGDGYDDVIAGAYVYNSSTGRAYIYYGAGSMDAEADVTLNGEGASNYFGRSVSGAGDVNGDGYDDVIVGANNYNNYTGRAYIYYGAGSMDAEADVTLNGEGTSNNFGYSVSGAGDVNGDGYDDVIVGAYYYNIYTGRAYIYYGAGSMDAEADVTLNGEGTSNYFGYLVSGAGDVNSDGYDDVIVGAYGYNSSTGRAYIYYGAGSMDAEADVTLNGEGTSNYFGYSVSGAGDVNGDGYDEVIVGAYGYNSSTGRAYIYYGAGSMDAEADVTLNGEGTYNYFGYSVSGAGDVNGAGYDDVIVGAYRYNSSTGRAYIYYGAGSMGATADVILDGEGTSNNFGYSVSGAGDVNGDGYDDVIVGANNYNSNTGMAYIYYGAGSMDAAADVTLDGEGTYNYFGASVSGAGDVNGDGYDDVIVGAYNNPVNGKVYIYSDPLAPLPVELISFTLSVLDNRVFLTWQTATEVNNYGFEVERTRLRSPNYAEAGWVTIGFVPGHGNSNSPKSYEFIDTEAPAGKLQYRLKQIDTDGKYEYYGTIAEVDLSVSDIQDHEVIPTEYGLSQNYPNPFNPSTAIRYQIPSVDALSSVEVLVTLKIYDTLGREVATLVNEQKAPGHYEVQFDGSKLASGTYIYRLIAGDFISVKKLIMIK